MALARPLPQEAELAAGRHDFSHSRRNDMLVLSRKAGEKVVIGNGITLTVVEVKGNRVRLALDAPDQVRILRGELACRHGDALDADLDEKPDWSSAAESGLELELTCR
jgi:carbon storage regulator CsrA